MFSTDITVAYNLIGSMVYSRGSLLGNILHLKFWRFQVCSTWLSNRAWCGRIVCILSIMYFNKTVIGQAGSRGGSTRQEVEAGQ